MKKYFVTGIGTDIGKTIVSAVLVEGLKADYWKPIQSGGLDFSDTDFVKSLIKNSNSIFHKESFRLTEPLSPHASARIDNVKITLDKIQIPETNSDLIIEGAGGLMVPLNDYNLMVVDLINYLSSYAIIVSRHYLGSINHTLLTIDYLKNKNISIAGIIFNGDENKESEFAIRNYAPDVPFLGRINQVDQVDSVFINQQKKNINWSLLSQ